MMRVSFNASTSFKADRTGLRTVHTELIHDNGNVTDEELWSVRFLDLNRQVGPTRKAAIDGGAERETGRACALERFGSAPQP